ncbi:NAD-dependent epimerase/dehydratase family protein [Archangium gephyra]|uniref:NAD-dependent epimerase/dehydratase family protein n=1 Tax=Archangium gephyra TaxID=48 RepID=UPI003B75F1A8
MAESVFITGSAGFVGRALAARVRAEGRQCLGVGRTPREEPGYHAIDLAEDAGGLTELLTRERPSLIYHLAGGPGGGARGVFASNTATTIHLFQAVQAVPGYQPRVLVAGSAAEYGDLGTEPISEDARERPVGEYGVAKLASTRLALLARRRGLRVGVVRFFNIIGPGMPGALAPARFARESLALAAAGGGCLTVGDLTPVRDYVDVADVVDALWTLGQREPEEEILNLCSGQPVRMGSLLEEILRQVGGRVEVRTAEQLLRGPGDVPVSLGDTRRLERVLGRRIPFDLSYSVARLLESLRAR